MTPDELFSALGLSRDYSTMPMQDLAEDLQGWGSQHPLFRQIITAARPELILEVGTWKGASAIHMAKIAAELELETKIICIDTWLGSDSGLWADPETRAALRLRWGYPDMFRQFIFNICAQGVNERIYPLPMTSGAAARLLGQLEIVADAIYIDADHAEDQVAMDLKHYYPLLKVGGVLFGDNYEPDEMGVVRAVNRFCADMGLMFSSIENKWYVVKTEQD